MARQMNIRNIESDEDVVFLGYKCVSTLDSVPSFKDVFYRLWLWENDKGEQVVTLDTGNGYCDYVPWEDVRCVDEEYWLRAANLYDLVRGSLDDDESLSDLS